MRDHWDELFDVYVKNNTYRIHNQTMPLLDFNITALGDDGMTMNYSAKFYRPFMLGLLQKKSDSLFIHMKYDLLDTKGYFKDKVKHLEGMILGNVTLTRLWKARCSEDAVADAKSPYGSTANREKIFVKKRINLQFNWEEDSFAYNEQMGYMRSLAVQVYWYLIVVVLLQFGVLLYRQVGLLPMWILVEYMQLVSFIPLYNFKFIPYIYDAFKPFLVAHLVLTNDPFVLTDMKDDYFNINYDYYWLSIAKLGQSLFLMFVLFMAIMVCNIAVGVAYYFAPKESEMKE